MRLVTNLGIAVGERAMTCDLQRWVWGVDAYEAPRADGLESLSQVVVLDPTVPHGNLSYGRCQAHAFDSEVRERFINGMFSLL